MLRFATILMISFWAITCHGQQEDSIKFTTVNFYAGGQVAIPSAEFRKVIKNSTGNLGYGLYAGFLMSPLGKNKPSPILVGIDFGFFTYGNEKQKGVGNTPTLKTTHNVFTWNAAGRLKPIRHQGKVTPFVDGLIGLKLFNSKTKIDKDLTNLVFNDNQNEVINNVNDTGLNYGLGVGFYTNPQKTNAAGFQLRLLYLWGDEVKYVVRNSVVVNQNGNVTFDTARANTSMVIIQIGFTALALKTLVGAN